MASEQEKLYDSIVDASFKCKSIEDVNKLVAIFEANKWGGTNYRMLKWILDSKVKHFNKKKVVTETKESVIENKESVIIHDSLKKNAEKFMEMSMN